MTKPAPKPRGRPAKLKMPDPIPDTPENIMRAVFNTKPKKVSEWKYMRQLKAGK